MHVALFLGSSIRQSGRLLTARFEVQVLAEELIIKRDLLVSAGLLCIYIQELFILCAFAGRFGCLCLLSLFRQVWGSGLLQKESDDRWRRIQSL